LRLHHSTTRRRGLTPTATSSAASAPGTASALSLHALAQPSTALAATLTHRSVPAGGVALPALSEAGEALAALLLLLISPATQTATSSAGLPAIWLEGLSLIVRLIGQAR